MMRSRKASNSPAAAVRSSRCARRAAERARLEMEGRAPVTAKAGQSIVEPPQVKMTGYNRSGTEPMRVVIFYVSDPDTPFLAPAHQ